jgi:hypothetical protein
MDKTERWRLLLGRILELFCEGKKAELARRIAKDASYVNRLFYPAGKAGAKRIGPEIMEACASAFPLPLGFWEMNPSEVFPNGPPPGWAATSMPLMTMQAGDASPSAVDAIDALLPAIDFSKVGRLRRDDRLRLEGAWLEAASRLRLDIAIKRK